MIQSRRLRAAAPVLAQCGIAVASLAMLAFAPPAQGRLLIISIGGESSDALARWVSANDARIIGAGPGGSSLIAEGNGVMLGLSGLSRGALVLAGPAPDCGPGAQRS